LIFQGNLEIKDLENNGIFLSETPAREGTLPEHIDGLRGNLLHFNTASSDAAKKRLAEQYEPIQEEAKILHNGKDREAEWATFFLFHFFRPLERELRVTDEDEWQ
jgi:hypothetical protein